MIQLARDAITRKIGLAGDWRSGSAAALHAVGRGFESLIAHHLEFPMKTLFTVALLACVSISLVFGQAEQVKKKAKDLKRDIETQQTNQIKGATNAPARR